MNRTDAMRERYHYCLSNRAIRRVWAAVTLYPLASVRELAPIARLNFRSVAAALRMLHDAGYIDAPAGLARARRIIIPFVIIGDIQR